MTNRPMTNRPMTNRPMTNRPRTITGTGIPGFTRTEVTFWGYSVTVRLHIIENVGAQWA